MAKLFYKKISTEGQTTNASHGKILWVGFFVLIATAIILMLVLQSINLYHKASTSWEEIMFAYHKPALVKVIREDYEEKQMKLEKSFLIKEKSSEEKLVDEVVKRLQATDQLK